MANTAEPASQSDLISVTAFFSVLLHTVLILGISFKLPDIAARSNTDNGLEVVMLSNANRKESDEAELVSSAANSGGGTDDREGSTNTPWKEVNPSKIESIEKTARREVNTQISPDQLITAKEGQVSIQRIAPKQTKLRVDGSRTGRDKLTAEAIKLERERLLAKLSSSIEAYEKRPKKAFLGPATKEHGAAEYLSDWKSRVVDVGNANYPVKIKTLGLSGTVIVSVEINSNGTIHDIKIINKSPHKLLNETVKRILRDASPFQAFPDKEFFKDTNILVITRAYHFLPDNSFDSTASSRG